MSRLQVATLWVLSLCLFLSSSVFAATEASNRQLLHRAKNGELEAMYQLASNYMEGDGCKVDYLQAAVWFLKASDKGNNQALVKLGDCYAEGLGGPYNDVEAFKLYSRAAEAGNAEGHYKLGRCYDLGLGVAANYYRALEQYQAAAEQGNYQALYALSNLFGAKRTAFPNSDKSNGYLSQAAEAFGNTGVVVMDDTTVNMLKAIGGEVAQAAITKATALQPDTTVANMSALAQYNAGRGHLLAQELGLEGDRSVGFEFLTKAADKGLAPARLLLAEDCIQTNSADTGIKMLEEIAAEGNRQAAVKLSQVYYSRLREGAGSIGKYLAITEKLARGGDLVALADLVNYYAAQPGESRTYMDLLNRAAKLGSGSACLVLAELYRTGNSAVDGVSVEVDLDQAYKYLSRACEGISLMDYSKVDLREAFCTLANMYYYGKGTEADLAKAATWYRNSLQLAGGYSPAAYRLGSIMVKGEGGIGTVDEGRDLLQRVANDSEYPEMQRAAKQLLK